MATSDGAWFRPRLELYEIEGHGRSWEAYETGTYRYLGSFDTGEDVCKAFGGRIALVYGYDAYEAACAVVIDQDPQGFDLSDVKPRPFLVRVRTVEEIAA